MARHCVFGEIDKWPNFGQKGHRSPAFSGVPYTKHTEGKESGEILGKISTKPCLLGGPLPS